jgi:hypothetical protein
MPSQSRFAATKKAAASLPPHKYQFFSFPANALSCGVCPSKKAPM